MNWNPWFWLERLGQNGVDNAWQWVAWERRYDAHQH